MMAAVAQSYRIIINCYLLLALSNFMLAFRADPTCHAWGLRVVVQWIVAYSS